MIAIWTIKIEEGGKIVIGIDSSDCEYINSHCFRDCYDRQYGWCGYLGNLYSNFGYQTDKPMFGKGDIIKMELSVSKQILKFYKNDEINLKCNDIDTSKTYRMAISVQGNVRLKMLSSVFIP